MLVSADDVAAAIIEAAPVDQMQLHKLLYLVQAASLTWYGNPAFGDQIEAWTYGPMVRGVAGHYMDWGQHEITEPSYGDARRVPEQTRHIVRYVLGRFGNLSGLELAAMVKKPGTPWRQVRGDLPDEARSKAEIPKDLIQEFHAVHGLDVSEPPPDQQALIDQYLDGDKDALASLFADATGVRPVVS